MKKESQPRIDFSRDKKSAIRNQQSEILLGAHMSIAGGAHLAIERACSINCTASVMSSAVDTSLTFLKHSH